MYLRVVLGAALGCLLTGCVTTTPAHNLSEDAVRALRLERVEVAVDPTAKVAWGNLGHDLMAAKSKQTGTEVTDPQAVASEFKAEVMTRLRASAKKTLEPALRTRLAGGKPVIARVTMHHVFIPTTGGVLVSTMFGGSMAPGAQSGMSASIDFVDAKTGATILSYPKTGFMTQGGQKWDIGTSGMFSHDPMERMFADMGGQVAAWLAKG
jgi:hypothetical protein